jgi:hypothetical protein
LSSAGVNGPVTATAAAEGEGAAFFASCRLQAPVTIATKTKTNNFFMTASLLVQAHPQPPFFRPRAS